MLDVGRWTLGVFGLDCDDTDASSLPHHLCRSVFDWAARGIESPTRYLHPHWNRNHAGSRKPEFYRVLAFWSAPSAANGRYDRTFFYCHCRGRSRRWSCHGDCRLPALSDNERRSIRPAQGIAETDEANAQRSTLNAQHSTRKLF